MSPAVLRLILTAGFEVAKLIIDAIDGNDDAQRRVSDILPERLHADLARERYRRIAKTRLSQ